MKTLCAQNIGHNFRRSSTNPTTTFSEEDFPLKTSIQRASDMDLLNPRNPDLTSSSNFLSVVRRRLGSIPAGCKDFYSSPLSDLLWIRIFSLPRVISGSFQGRKTTEL